jgi:hypothetical protein
MPNYPRLHFGGGENSFGSKTNSFRGLATDKVSNEFVSLVSIKLAASPFSRCRMHFFFTESLILAQDERWRRA